MLREVLEAREPDRQPRTLLTMEQASDDELLWRRVAAGDSTAFGTIFERHARKGLRLPGASNR
jgi:hypothetical protein